MEQLIIEQTENETHAAMAEEDLGGGKQEFSFKKFKDVESLQKAYSSLESEFTKRSQRLKELEGERQELLSRLEIRSQDPSGDGESQPSGENEFEVFFKKYPEVRSNIEELSEIMAANGNSGENGSLERAYISLLRQRISGLQASLSDEDYLISHIEGTSIKDRVIRDYLANIKNSRPSSRLISSGGEIVLSPPIRPKTLDEAAKLTKAYLQKI